MPMKTKYMLLICTVLLSLCQFSQSGDLAGGAPNEESGQAHAKIGEQLMKEGKFDGALVELRKGYAVDQNRECLLGILGVAMVKKNSDLVGEFIEPVMKLDASDAIFLKIGVAYSIQVKDQKLFVHCLALARNEWLEKDKDLTFGIARGSIMFFSEKADK